ncbi:hypothetical protein P7K49_025611 [Saguinus oedipus]|uniref:Calponin-homology (CH) domain-containing protein n=1 Tax=Saguinus oedipus TaxID=9490 RepID=A0ABQ9UJY7_SAGOE|nr:hypothetical protein P7K49_025611 [Saguinus oedipus]
MNNSGYSDAGLGLGDEADEMPSTEKDLAEDAPWKKIQQNTFTRWCNEHLKCVGKRLTDLQRDLSDGLRLIALLEVLSQKRMYRKFHPRPNFRQMKLENVSVALEFLEREHIKLVSIGQCVGGEDTGAAGVGSSHGAEDTSARWANGELRQGRGRPPGTERRPWPQPSHPPTWATGTACTPSGDSEHPWVRRGVQALEFASPPAAASPRTLPPLASAHSPISFHRATPAHTWEDRPVTVTEFWRHLPAPNKASGFPASQPLCSPGEG